MHGLPNGEGVIDRKAHPGRVIAFYSAIFVAGAVAMISLEHIAHQDARAAEQERATLEQKIDQVVSDVASMKGDIRAIKCRVNLENTCPR